MRRLAMLSAVGFACAISGARADALPITLVSITQPVHPGDLVTLVIRTTPGAACRGRRQGHFGNAYSIPLRPQVAAADGQAQWRWSVLAGTHPIGLRGVHVTCSVGSDSGVLDTTFDVQ